jgi:hypothetical protein
MLNPLLRGAVRSRLLIDGDDVTRAEPLKQLVEVDERS